MLKRTQVKGSDQVKLTFVLPHDPQQPRVYVAGDFNDWNPTATPLVKRGNDTRSASVMIDGGKRYAFRYVTADGEWFNDNQADEYIPNELGVQNCIVCT